MTTFGNLFLTAFVAVLVICPSFALSPFVIHESTVWETGLGEISAYRTPILINTPGGLLAFCGARKYSKSDTGAKVVTMRRSLDGGLTWKPTVFLVDDFDAPNGLNIGVVIVDTKTNLMILTFSFCVHNLCPEHIPRNYLMRSSDWGYSWTEPEDFAQNNPYFQAWPYGFGPGYGIIKQYPPNVGRMFACGHTVDRDKFKTQSMNCLYSDDMGKTWTIGASIYSVPYGMEKKSRDLIAGEPQPVELPDGSITVNIRNSYGYHCNCRLIAKSFDGGVSFPWQNITLDEELIEPGCQGSLLVHNKVMYFSNPNSNAGRLNMTVKYSFDYGENWVGSVQIYPNVSEYSCLSPIDDNNIGVLYEKDGYHKMGFAKIRLNP
ncbi:sialidase-1-like [Ptychodera flava]|uniref:sialidase-1-like n=1 Tax=Ptychodera flava TaxID=63121 RepID=UPI003969BD14